MVLRVQRIGEKLGIMLTPEAIAALNLRAGSAVEVEAAEGVAPLPLKIGEPITADEAIASYLRTEPAHLNTYRELAK